LYAFLLAAVMATPALAQGGSADPTGDFSSHAAIQQRLAVAESEIAALDGSADDTVREMLQQLQTALYQHLEAVEYLDTIRQQAVSVSAEARSWKPDPTGGRPARPGAGPATGAARHGVAPADCPAGYR